MRFSRSGKAVDFFGLGLLVLILGAVPAVASTTDDEAQAAEQVSDSGDESDRTSRREQRRQLREERRQLREASRDEAAGTTDAEAAAAAGFIVAVVEPEMECSRRVVSGSRVPKEVCVPVGQDAADEATAKEFLRRIRERSGEVQPRPPTMPGLGQ